MRTSLKILALLASIVLTLVAAFAGYVPELTSGPDIPKLKKS
ncbi:hypothetical protein J2857_005260 [Neorhizobium galegae]|nr:hypothetical protein [Neorhizobium galegae]MBP2562469.1 hypothetical protein [Neorhizobium galegae]